jgi:ElaA protein
MERPQNALAWACKRFSDLTLDELYAILRLRTDVFSVEQQAVYQDLDGKDQPSQHLMGRVGDQLHAYCRLLPAGVAFPEVSIGRVVTSLNYRNTGTGKELMSRALDLCRQEFGDTDIRIGAQYHLTGFYGSFGFVVDGTKYLEDGIEHVHMLRKAGGNGRQ